MGNELVYCPTSFKRIITLFSYVGAFHISSTLNGNNLWSICSIQNIYIFTFRFRYITNNNSRVSNIAVIELFGAFLGHQTLECDHVYLHIYHVTKQPRKLEKQMASNIWILPLKTICYEQQWPGTCSCEFLCNVCMSLANILRFPWWRLI